MSGRGKWLFALALATIAGIAITLPFRGDLRTARERLEGRSALIQTAAGRMEYAVVGSGPPLLMLHGTGGGFDQGLLFPEKLAGKGVQVVTGYLLQ